MKLRAFLALATVIGAGIASPAHAQFYGRTILSERMVLQGLQERGFRRMSPPVLNNDVFVLDAVDPRGQPVRLIVSAFNGRIVDAHPQRHTRWSRIDPEDGWDEDNGSRHERWQRERGRADRWRDERQRERQARLPDRDDRWSGPQVDPDEREPSGTELPDFAAPSPAPQAGSPTGRRAPERLPERVIVSPLPAPSTQQRDPDLPQPTLKNPTIVKRSPTAIPKPPEEKSQTGTRPPAVSTAPQPKPGMGTRDNPRVIELAPKAPAAPPPRLTTPAPPPAPPVAPAPKAAAAPPATPAMPPPAILESAPRLPAPAEPSIPPATLE